MTPGKQQGRRPSDATDIALIKQNITYIQADIASINQTLKASYVSLDQFNALKDRVNLLYRAVFFLLGIVAVGILGAVFKVILK